MVLAIKNSALYFFPRLYLRIFLFIEFIIIITFIEHCIITALNNLFLQFQEMIDDVNDILKRSITSAGAFLLGVCVITIINWLKPGVCKSKARLDGKTVIVTGCTSGKVFMLRN